MAKEKPVAAIHSLRRQIFQNFDQLLNWFSKRGKMSEVTGYLQLDFNVFKSVVWGIYRLLAHYHNIYLPLKARKLHYKPKKTLFSNCIHGIIQVKELLSVLCLCLYHPQINQLFSLLNLEKVTDDIIACINSYIRNL